MGIGKDKKEEEREKGKLIPAAQLATFVILSSLNWFLCNLNLDCPKGPCLIVLSYLCVDFIFTVKLERTLRAEIQSFTSLYPLLSLYLTKLIGIAWSVSVLIFVSHKMLKLLTILEFCIQDIIRIQDLETRGIWLVSWMQNSFETEQEAELRSSDPSSTHHPSAPRWLISLVPPKTISEVSSLKLGSGQGI